MLHAYDGSRDQFAGNKFIAPMVANGRVHVGTPNRVAVFGLLLQQLSFGRNSLIKDKLIGDYIGGIFRDSRRTG